MSRAVFFSYNGKKNGVGGSIGAGCMCIVGPFFQVRLFEIFQIKQKGVYKAVNTLSCIVRKKTIYILTRKKLEDYRLKLC